MRREAVWRPAFLAIALIALAGCGRSPLGSAATTEEGIFFSGPTRLSYAIDIPVTGSPPYPLVVFGFDSGANTKNEREDWARRLVEVGIGVFRFDKRGVGESEGEYRRGSVDPDLQAGDLVAAVDFVVRDPRVDPARIGVMGASQAGWIVPMVAARSAHVAFTVLLYGPAVTNAQHNYWVEIAEDEGRTITELSSLLADFELPPGDFDPRPFIEEMTAPGLWLFGEEDRIIPARESAQIVREVATALGRPFTVIVYPDVGHGLRGVDYWVDLLPWLDAVIR